MNKKQTKTTAETAMDQIAATLADDEICPSEKRTRADGSPYTAIKNQSEALGILFHKGLMTSETIPALLADDRLATMRAFLNPALTGKQEKTPAIKKGELAAQNAAMARELAELKAKLRLA